jgi:hypothetical protein
MRRNKRGYSMDMVGHLAADVDPDLALCGLDVYHLPYRHTWCHLNYAETTGEEWFRDNRTTEGGNYILCETCVNHGLATLTRLSRATL